MFKAIIHWFITLFVLSFLTVVITVVAVVYDYNKFLKSPLVIAPLNKSLSVQSGNTVSGLAKRLKQQDIGLASENLWFKFMSPYYFKYLLKSYANRIHLKVGDYPIHSEMTIIDLLNTLVEGKARTYKIRFQEGWTLNQIRKEIEKNALIEQTLNHVSNERLMVDLGIKDKHYEGQFFPDTYVFAKGTKDKDILLRAYYSMQEKIKSAWIIRSKKNRLKSPYELLVLASIIEKETGVSSERKLISGVFHRRLAKKMKLQTDPTVIYGMKARYKGKIYKSDLKKDTPYNTYTRSGLPPTPIAMPSYLSLVAAGQPDKGKSLFFVADGKGGHVFSDTYQKHLKAVKAYRKLQNN